MKELKQRRPKGRTGKSQRFRDKAGLILRGLQFQALVLISQLTSRLPSCLPNGQIMTGTLYKSGENRGWAT